MLVSTCDGGCILDGHVLLQVCTLKSWPSYSFFTCCVNITCHIASLFMDIYTCSHTLVAPHGLQNLGGDFCPDVCKSCIDDSN